MSRSRRKGPYVDAKLFRKVQKQNEAGTKEPIKTWARACTIVPEFVGHTFMVHNGKPAHEGVCDRRHGGPPAGRVRPDADLPRARRQGQALEGVTAMAFQACHRFARISPARCGRWRT